MSTCFVTLLLLQGAIGFTFGTSSVNPITAVAPANTSTHREALDVVEVLGCRAAVHKAAGSKANFVLEPLLCWRAGMEELVCPGFDYLRSRHFLRVPVLLTDPAVPDQAKMQLFRLFPTSVMFMDTKPASFQLTNVDKRVEMELEDQLGSSKGSLYLIIRAYCRSQEHCQSVRLGLGTQPRLFFEAFRLSLIFGPNPAGLRQANRSVSAGNFACRSSLSPPTPAVGEEGRGGVSGSQMSADSSSGSNQTRVLEVDGEHYFLVQQRISDRVSFQRNWTDYENGFGVLSGDYWMGLRLLHSLTKANRALRVELVRFRGSAFDQDFFHAEYTNFRVGPPPLYSLSYAAFNKARSSALGDALADSRGRGFSTVDRDNDSWADSCSQLRGGGGGWWFSSCGSANLNGVFHRANSGNESGIRWAFLDSMATNARIETLKHTRILLRV